MIREVTMYVVVCDGCGVEFPGKDDENMAVGPDADAARSWAGEAGFDFDLSDDGRDRCQKCRWAEEDAAEAAAVLRSLPGER